MNEETKPKIPALLLEGITNYVEHRVKPGGFLSSVLQNDLVRAYGRADEESLRALPQIINYLNANVPATCWGSPEKYSDWLAKKDLE